MCAEQEQVDCWMCRGYELKTRLFSAINPFVCVMKHRVNIILNLAMRLAKLPLQVSGTNNTNRSAFPMPIPA